MDNVIRVNLVNFITIGLMAFIFVYIVNLLTSKFLPKISLSGVAATNAAPVTVGSAAVGAMGNSSPVPTVAYTG